MPGGAMKLTEDARDGKTRSVSVKTNWELWVKVFEDGSSRESMFELIESSLAGRGPMESLALAEERGNR
jgi:hypothetical protein